MRVAVKVRLKRSILDPQGKTVQQALQHLGFEQIREVRIGKLIELETEEGQSREKIQQMLEAAGRKLLSNPVMEDFEIEYPGELP